MKHFLGIGYFNESFGEFVLKNSRSTQTKQVISEAYLRPY